MAVYRSELPLLHDDLFLTDGGIDRVSALTMPDAQDAVGIARAAGHAGLPVALSFTIDTDGRLPTGIGRIASRCLPQFGAAT